MASGSVVEQCVWLLRFSQWKFTVGLEPSPAAEAARAVQPARSLAAWKSDKAGQVHYHLFARKVDVE